MACKLNQKNCTDLLWDLGDLYEDPNKSFNDRVAIVKNVLLKNQIIVTSKGEQGILKNVLFELLDTTLPLDYEDQLDQLDDFVNAVINSTEVIPQPAGVQNMEIVGEEELLFANRVPMKRIDELYFSAQVARAKMQETFRNAVISSLFINFKQGRLINNIDQYNLNITHLFNTLVQNMLAFRNFDTDVEDSLRMYNDDGTYIQGSFEKVQLLAKELFEGFTDLKLNQLQENIVEPKNAAALAAYNSWVILNNFDMLAENLLGKTIKIAPQYSGAYTQFVDANKLKYQIAFDSNVIKTWRTEEQVDALKELGSVTKILVETAPMYQYSQTTKNGKLLPGQTMKLRDFSYAILQLKQHPNLQYEWTLFKEDPGYYAPMILKTALQDNIVFTVNNVNIKNILYSIYRRFYDLTYREGEEYSLSQIMGREMQENSIFERNYLSFITNAIDKMVPIHHLQYEVNEDGNIEPVITSSTNVTSTYRITRDHVDNINNSITKVNRELLVGKEGKYKLTSNTKYRSNWSVERTVAMPNGDAGTVQIQFSNVLSNPTIKSITIFEGKGRTKKIISNPTPEINAIIKASLIELVDDTLRQNFSKRSALFNTFVELYDGDEQAALNDLVISACRILVKHDLENRKITDIKKFYNIHENGRLDPILDPKQNKIRSYIKDKHSLTVFTRLAQAKTIINGDIAKQTTKNLNNDSVANQGLTNMMNTIKSIFRQQTRDQFLTDGRENATRHSIFAENPNLIIDLASKSYAQSVDRKGIKAEREFSVGEFGHSLFMYDFLHNYSTNGTFYIQPTVPSDKVTNLLLHIDGNAYFRIKTDKGIERKQLKSMSAKEIQNLQFERSRLYYGSIKRNITKDYKQFLKHIYQHDIDDILGIRKLLTNIDELSYETITTVIFPSINTFYKKLEDGKKAKAIIDDKILENPFFKYASKFSNAGEFYDDISRTENLMNLVEIHHTSKSLTPNRVLDFYFKMFAADDELQSKAVFDRYMNRNRAKFLKDCIENFKIEARIKNQDGSYDFDPTLKKSITAYCKNHGIDEKEEGKLYKQWIDPETDELIFGKIIQATDTGYNVIPITKSNIGLLGTDSTIELNPLLDLFFATDNLISTQFITNTVGGCFGHKDNFNGSFDQELQIVEGMTREEIEEIEFLRAEQEEAGRVLTQFKRMVIYPATMHNYGQNKLEGVPSHYNTAIIADIKANAYNYLGDNQKIDAHDGSAFCLYWVAKIQNNSLGDAAAGTDSKPIGAGMYNSYGMGWEYKYALFAMDNERSRQSKNPRGTGTNWHNMIKKMSSGRWLSMKDVQDGYTLDITKDYLGQPTKLSDINSKGIFYYDEETKSHYRIMDIVKLDSVDENGFDANQYQITICKVNKKGAFIDSEGNETGFPIEEQYSREIKSNYDLWSTFGGDMSKYLSDDGVLVYGNTSGDAVAYYANRVGILRLKDGKKPHQELVPPELRGNYLKSDEVLSDIDSAKYQRTLTQADVWQPLKYSDIAYLVNTSACKNGQANVNTRDQWYSEYDETNPDTQLRTVKISTMHMGIQMDADHHADESQVSEMSQVMSSLEENGHTHEIAEAVYKDLGSIIQATLHNEIDALADYYSGINRGTIYTIVKNAFIKSFSRQGRNSTTLAESIIYNIQQQLSTILDVTDDQQIFVPFSDNNILGSAISTITSNINNTAIKRKYPGIASILVPAYDIYKVYRIGNRDYTYSDLIEKGIDLAEEQMKLEQDEDNKLTNKQLSLGMSYVQIDENGNRTRITLDTIEKRKELRTEDKYKNYTYYIDLEAGRNLQGHLIEFTINNENYNMYDSDQISDKIKYAEGIHDLLQSVKQLGGLENKRLAYLDFINKIRNNNEYFSASQNKESNANKNGIINGSKVGSIGYYLDQAAIAVENNQFWKADSYLQFIDYIIKNNMIEAFRDLKENNIVTIDGVKHKLDDKSISKKEAELILPKIFATIFGLKEGETLSDINLEYFEKQIKNNLKIGDGIQAWDIAFKRGNGNHTYIVLNENDIPEGAYRVEVPTVYDFVTGKNMRVGQDNEIMMPFDNCTLYVHDGIEYVVTDNIEQFITVENNYDTVDINWRKSNVRETASLLLQYDDDILDDLRDAFETKVKNTRQEGDSLNSYNLDDISDGDFITIQRTLENNINAKINKLASDKYTSFRKSLQFTAARIPSQAMQSFMSMKVVAFTDSPDNKAYVSHFQTYLQGSDYDIDKVFLLGFEFDRTGKFIGWSPLFDLFSLKTLEESEKLPMPNGKKIQIVDSKDLTPEEKEKIIDIQNEVNQIILSKKQYDPSSNKSKDTREEEEARRIATIQAYVQLLTKIYDSEDTVFRCDSSTFDMLAITPEQIQKEIRNITRNINKHNFYVSNSSNSKGIKMMKNSASSKIRRVIDDELNAVAATTPIQMDQPKDAASMSALGKAEKTYTQCNPAVKWIMRNQNMVGKKSIGITAVGQKALLALQYYYNAATRSNDPKWHERACFEKRFDFNIGLDQEKKIPMIFNIISNINFQNTQPAWKAIIEKNVQDMQTSTSEDRDYLADLIIMQLILTQDTALINSQLISAATDNAKELLLSKLNATPDLLKVYIYSITLGVEFNQIASLMISPTVQSLNELSQEDIFSHENEFGNINKVIKAIEKGIPIPKGRTEFKNQAALVKARRLLEFGDIEKEGAKYTWEDLFKISVVSFDGMVEIMRKRIDEARNILRKEYKVSENGDYKRAEIFRYINNLERLVNALSNIDKKDFLTFKDLVKNSEEFTSFGRALSINQGIEVSLKDKIDTLIRLEDIFSSHVQTILSPNGLNYAKVVSLNPQLKYYHGGKLQDYVSQVTQNAIKAGILTHDPLSPNGSFEINFDILRFLRDKEYQEIAIDLYDLSKDTFNIFDIIVKLPHFYQMFRAAMIDMELIKHNSTRAQLTYKISRELKKKHFKFLNQKKSQQLNNNISNFIQDIIVSKYFAQLSISARSINAYTEEYNSSGDLTKVPKQTSINLATPEGQATFKHWMENTVIPRLQSGYTSDTDDTVNSSIYMNRFISDLMCMSSTLTLTGQPRYVYTLPIKMDSPTLKEDPVYMQYLNDFNKLWNYKYNDVSLPKLFFYYNLITNKNKPGQYSLTPIFDQIVKKNNGNNYVFDYFKYVGKMDIQKLLTEADFSMQDLLIACAIPMTRSEVTDATSYPFIKIWNNATGQYDLYQYSAADYDDMYYDGDIPETDASLPSKNYVPYIFGNDEQSANIINDFPNVQFEFIKTAELQFLSTSIKDLFTMSKLLIYMNCE